MNNKVAGLVGSAILSLLPMISSVASEHIKIAFTTDVHGNFFPTDYVTLGPSQGSLSRALTAIDSLRSTPGGENLILLDNGDILQGQPTVYYYNYIDTTAKHIASEIYNFMGYDATTIGNHDIEAGHPVYDRWRKANNMPLLGANVIDTATGQPYFTPYTIVRRGKMKIAVLGLLTPAIPSWLPEILWSGMRFEDMTESARKWVEIIKREENPDIIIGLFHSGHDESTTTGNVTENASVKVAREVPGFDAVLIGHDHQRFQRTVVNTAGDTVHVINPANAARAIGVIDIIASTDAQGKLSKAVTTEIVDVTQCETSPRFMAQFENEQKAVSRFVERVIGSCDRDMSTQDAFFGPSAFMSLLHQLQLSISGADISFAAPLSFDAVIRKGPVRISDMFTLYKYENMLYTLDLTGREIKDYLEESYDQWIRTVTPSQPHMIAFASAKPTPTNNRLARPSYNFDSAAGIDYTVDITKPKGSRIAISGMSDGRPFDQQKHYTVAVNSYRANGGGNLLTDGAKIYADKLKERIVRATERDLRYYLIKEIEQNPELHVATLANWRFVPEERARIAAEADRAILFGRGSSKEQK